MGKHIKFLPISEKKGEMKRQEHTKSNRKSPINIRLVKKLKPNRLTGFF